jgi:hypothetical protein
MGKGRYIQSGRPAGKIKNFKRGDLAVFIFFVCLSFFFWYLNSLGKDLQTDIKYPVRYTNIPKDWKLSENTIQKVNLYLNGPGYSILRMKISGRHAPLEIDFSKVDYKHVQNGESADYFIVTSNLVSRLNSQLKSECEVTSIKPDTIFLTVR